MRIGYYESLANRLSITVGRNVVYLNNSFQNNRVDAYFDDLTFGESIGYHEVKRYKVCSVDVETACKRLIERYFVDDGNPDYRKWLWIDDSHLDRLRSKSFRELEIKLGLMGC